MVHAVVASDIVNKLPVRRKSFRSYAAFRSGHDFDGPSLSGLLDEDPGILTIHFMIREVLSIK
jgi:hypothetical protein